jgi:ABC-type antimicrobial peptide transport system permease subunit
VIRLAARRLWTRRLQALAPLIALLAATLGFQAVLVSARSTQSHVQGVIAANWNPPYDLLVRPPSLVTGLQPGDHLIRPDYLLSARGGISLAQVGMVRQVPGVTVAAPVGVVAIEYLQGVDYAVDVSTLPRVGDFNVYKVTTTYTTDGGRSVVPSTPEYLIVQGRNPPYVWSPVQYSAGALLNVGGVTIECGFHVQCYSAPGKTPPISRPYPYVPPWGDSRFGHYTYVTVPVVAVDPAAEKSLSGLDACVTGGRPLSTTDAVTLNQAVGNELAGSELAQLPVLLNSSPGFDEGIHVTVNAASTTSVAAAISSFASLAGFEGTSRWPYVAALTLGQLSYSTVRTTNTSLDQTWGGLNGGSFAYGSPLRQAVDAAVDTTSGLQLSGRFPSLATKAVGDLQSGFNTYESIGGDWDAPPYVSQDTNFRTLTRMSASGSPRSAATPYHQFNVVGRYSSSCVSSRSDLSSSGYDIYAGAATTQPNSHPMGANASMTNFVAPMPEIMTNLAGGAYFSDPKRFAGGAGDSFLSVIRVKVAGTSVPGPASQKRLEQVAADIHRQTGLAVDIIKGSSTQAVSIALPAGNFGRPAMTVHQDWLKENVAINFYQAINNTTVVMSIVVAVVAVLLTMQTTYATVRRRRGELVLLRAVGWPSWRLALLMELEVIALGVLVALVAVVVAGFMILVNHPGGGVETGILLAAPAAILLTAVAGAGPAFIASRTRPLAALRGPGRLRRRPRRLVRGPFSLGVREALTTWRWQTLLGALATGVGALFLGAVLAILHDFHTSLDSTALAQQLSNEVGPFDVLLGVLAVALGATTAVSVVLVATRERLPHFATLRALGWSRVKVAQVVAGQAISVGLLGGVLGVIALSILANRVKTGIALTWSSQLSPLALGVATGVAAAVGAVRLVYRRVIVTVLRVG